MQRLDDSTASCAACRRCCARPRCWRSPRAHPVGPPKSGSAFLETWKDPDAQPLQLKGAKVVAVVMMNDPKARQRAEDALAQEITALGAQGVAMYSIAPSGVTPKEGESQTRAIVEAAGAKGLVVMRPVDVNHRTVATATPRLTAPMAATGAVTTASAGTIRGPNSTRTRKPTWSSRSRPSCSRCRRTNWCGPAPAETINPRDAEKFVHTLATETAKELQRQGLVGQ